MLVDRFRPMYRHEGDWGLTFPQKGVNNFFSRGFRHKPIDEGVESGFQNALKTYL